MSLLRRTVPMLALLGVGVGSLDAQIPIRQPNQNPAANSPRLLVSTPYTDRGGDSATAVAIGAALRTRFQRVVGTSYYVITREGMNRALAEYSYPADALLNNESARRLATAMQARIMLYSELGREGGRLKVRGRFAGLSDDAGNTMTVLQVPGQSVQAFGEAVATAFQLAVKGQLDAKACVDQVESNVAKANESAQKALRVFPAHGLAHACLADLAHKRSADDPAYATELDLAVKADSLSLQSLAALADFYNAKNDTANVVLKYTQMIEAAPTNRPLIERASRVFRSFGRPDAAERVADRGIALDSLDMTMWDLRSSACVFQQKFTCATESLEQMLVIDSTRADSNFLFRLAVTAGSAAADSAALQVKFLHWSQVGAAKYPANTNLVGQLLQAYKVAGMTDSVLKVTDRVLALDSTDMSPALSAIDLLITAQRWPDAVRYGTMVMAHGDAQQKLALGAAFTNAARTLLTQTAPPPDPVSAYGLLHLAIPAAGTDQRIAPLANFLMGFAGLQTASKSDSTAAATKSCDLARKMDGMLDEAKAGFTAGTSVNPPVVPDQLRAIAQYKTRTQSMITAYCH